ncbi:anthrone oxygenase family protein [Dactylosporangium sp. NPDC050688]|uniref:anthrone oxygenase family protein n=1 Tax=Dactylosporangium sp. NPDC050688 TaxID=3157217 RepID=UPI0033FF6B05
MRHWSFEIVRALATALVALYTGGVFFVVIGPSVTRLPADAYTRWWQAMNTDMRRAMPPLLLICLGLLILTAVLGYGRSKPAFVAAVVAILLIVATIGLTVSQLEPLNAIGDTWNPDAPPADWTEVRNRWQRLHLVRTLLALLTLVTLLAAHVVERATTPSSATLSPHPSRSAELTASQTKV